MSNKIEVYNYQLNEDAITELTKFSDLKMNAKYAFRMLRILNDIQSLVDTMNKLRNKVFQEYGEEVKENSGSLMIKKENMEAANKELSELMMVKSTITHDKFDLEEMGIDEKISVKTISLLSFLFMGLEYPNEEVITETEVVIPE